MAESQPEEVIRISINSIYTEGIGSQEFQAEWWAQEANRREGQPNSFGQRVMPIQTSNLLPELVRESGLNAEVICEIYSDASQAYKIYDIRQGKRGKKRTIQEPDPELKRIQKALIPIFERYQLSPFCTAIRGSSAVFVFLLI
jgi:hypothetical protein